MTSSALAAAEPGPEASAADLEEVRRLVESAGTSFFWAMRLLERDKREAMYAIYAYCREIDDIADEGGTREEKRIALDAWREEIAALYAGQPSRPISRALLPPLARYRLPQKPFHDLIDGMEMDAEGPIRAPSMAELELYCSRVAGAVGQLSVCVFGEPGPDGQQTAERLGQALQLTNILRDLQEDAEIGRLYLPKELLLEAGIESDEPREVLSHPGLPKVCNQIADKARQAFADAEAAMARCHNKANMRPARVMMEVYRDAFRSLEGGPWPPPPRKSKGSGLKRLRSKLRKLTIALRYGLFSL